MLKRNYRINVYFHNTEYKLRSCLLLNLKNLRPINKKLILLVRSTRCLNHSLPPLPLDLKILFIHQNSEPYLHFQRILCTIFSFICLSFISSLFHQHFCKLGIVYSMLNYQPLNFQGSLHNFPAFLMFSYNRLRSEPRPT